MIDRIQMAGDDRSLRGGHGRFVQAVRVHEDGRPVMKTGIGGVKHDNIGLIAVQSGSHARIPEGIPCRVQGFLARSGKNHAAGLGWNTPLPVVARRGFALAVQGIVLYSVISPKPTPVSVRAATAVKPRARMSEASFSLWTKTGMSLATALRAASSK